MKSNALRMFRSIFGGDKEGRERLPESVIAAAIESAVAGTDPRLRFVPGYRKLLRAPVIHAIEYVHGLVAGIPAPLTARRGTHGAEPCLSAVFASADDMLNQFARASALEDFLSSPNGKAEHVTAMVLAERSEKHVLGVDQMGDLTRREVTQVAVNFSRHHVLDPGLSEQQTRSQLERRGFEHLLGLARIRIAEVRLERAQLAHQRDVLRRGLRVPTRQGPGCGQPLGVQPQADAGLAELDTITSRLDYLGANQGVLPVHLEIVAEVLRTAEKQFWREDLTLHLDAMNIKREPQDPKARRVDLQEFRDVRGRRFVPLLLSLVPGDLPTHESFIAAAERCLLQPCLCRA